MAILVDKSTRVIVQGITGKEGSFHTQRMLEYGTNIVAGVTPYKGGQTFLGVPIFNTVQEAICSVGQVDATVIFVPAKSAPSSILEACLAGIKLIIVITEGIPQHDMLKVHYYLRKYGCMMIGPNCPGIATAGQTKIGIIPNNVLEPGVVGLVSRSGTISYEILKLLKDSGLGQTTVVGLGGDPLIGLRFKHVLSMFLEDDQTKAVVMVGEIGGSDEEEAAEVVKKLVQKNKPVISFIVGRNAPEGKRMGHAGAIIMGKSGKPDYKIQKLKEAGAIVVDTITSIPQTILQEFSRLNLGA
ncbi:MAG: succinate--CoA ligase subunit alpha [Candidatus Calescibacterium sp.]|nr:succinate--CoA ligase subunit alpha [Candidatus Calescibacterium sp.]MCX7972650.1 succinate--CoA ligase subunit alpha [bacterium]MDW8194753.1 succinate--CoA ligase subunit alpha [Candidatus Calescibacterium sp.]